MEMDWLARGQCGPWTDVMRQVYIGSHLIVGFCYVLIAATLVVAYINVRDRHFVAAWSVVFGSGVFLTCGLGHFFDGVGSFYYPRYDLLTAWHALTAGFALVFMFSLPWFLISLITRKGAADDGK